MFRLLAHRNATEIEQKICRDLVAKSQQRYTEDQKDAESLLAIGEAGRDPAIDVAVHAAWTQLASMILASDVAILLY